jgi:quercetin dioxygenase-like cupin family protein
MLAQNTPGADAMNTLKAALAAAAILATAGAAWAKPTQLAPVTSPSGKVVATVDLGAEFAAMKGYTFSQTVSTVPPGTGRALHSHKGQPEIVYVVSGVLTESHNGGPAKAYGPGSTLINAGGLSHMWANLGTEPVVMINTVVRPTVAP